MLRGGTAGDVIGVGEARADIVVGENLSGRIRGRRASPSLHHATVGVVGESRIGRLVIAMLSAFDIEILVYDPFLTEREAVHLGVRSVGLDALRADSDIITVYAPQLPETAKMIGDEQLRAMREGAVLINTARGALVDTEALTRHCAAGRIDAVLDVTEPERLPADHPCSTCRTWSSLRTSPQPRAAR